MYMVITLNPLYGSKGFYDSEEEVAEHIKKILELSKSFFKNLNANERREYNYSRIKNINELVKVVNFIDSVRKVFGTTKEPKPPITNDEYAKLCNQKNRARHMGKEV